MLDPRQQEETGVPGSWVARWQHISACGRGAPVPAAAANASAAALQPGVYAISAVGKLTDDAQKRMEDAGQTYRSRDTSRAPIE